MNNHRFIILICTALLIAVSGIGHVRAAIDIHSDGFEDPPTDPTITAPAMSNLKLVSVNSVKTDTVQLDWLAAESPTATPQQISYGLHASAEDNFVPDASTLLKTVQGTTQSTLSEVVAGLNANTSYYFIVTATDPQNNTIQSNQLKLFTAKVAQVRTATPAHNLPESDTGTQTVTDTSVTVPGSASVATGDIIANVDGQTYLRKVTSVSQSGGNTVMQTEQAAINQVFQDLELSFSTLMLNAPSKSTAQKSHTKAAPAAAGQTELVWPDGSLVLSYPDASISPSIVKHAKASGAEHTDTDGPLSVTTKKTIVSAADGKTPIRFDVLAALDSSEWKITELSLLSIKNSNIQPRDNNYGAIFINNIRTEPKHKGTFSWTPEPRHVDNDGEAYYVKFYALAIKKDCKVFCEEDVTITTKIYLGKEPELLGKGTLVATGTVGSLATLSTDITLEPIVHGDFTVEDAKLKKAKLYVEGDLQFTADLLLSLYANGQAQGEIDVEALRRTATKVFLTPSGIPVVVKTELGISLAFEGSASGQVDLRPEYTHTFNLAAGFEYIDGVGWSPIKSATQTNSFEFRGTAEGTVDMKVMVRPRFNVSFYAVGVLKTRLVPYLYNETAVSGLYNFLEPAAGVDVCLNQFDIGAGLDFEIRAGLEAFDKGIVGWPSRDPNDYKTIQVIPRTVLFGLPSLTTRLHNDTPQCPTDSRARLVQAIPGAGVRNPWKEGAWRKSIPVANTSLARVPSSVAQNHTSAAVLGAGGIAPPSNNFAWFVPQDGARNDYQARYYGHASYTGFLMNQCAYQDVPVTDSDNDGMDDAWESRYNVTDPNSDSDNDGLTALQEYQQGSYPNRISCQAEKPDEPEVPDQTQLIITDPNDGDQVFSNASVPVFGSGPASTPITLTATLSKTNQTIPVCTTTSSTQGAWDCTLGGEHTNLGNTITFKATATYQGNNLQDQVSIGVKSRIRTIPSEEPFTPSGNMVHFFINGKMQTIIPRGYSGRIYKIKTWWGNHSLRLDLNSDGAIDLDFDEGFPTPEIDHETYNLGFSNGFSVQDYEKWTSHWKDETHGCVAPSYCSYDPTGVGFLMNIDSGFKCVNNLWTLNGNLVNGEELYCRNIEVK